MKYFLFGGMSAAFLLFGFSLLYGISGSTNLADIAHGHRRQGLRSAAAGRAGDDRHRLRLQSGGGAVSFVGAGRLRRRAHAERRVYRRRFQGRELFHPRQNSYARFRRRGRQRRFARLRRGLDAGGGRRSPRFRWSSAISPPSCNPASNGCSPIRPSPTPVTCCWACLSNTPASAERPDVLCHHLRR